VQLSPEGEARLIEHRGYANAAPDPRAAEALARAISEINGQRGSLHGRLLATRRRRRVEQAGGADEATDQLYPFYEAFLREYMFRAYCAPYLGKEERELTHRDWLAEHALDRVARELFASLRDSFENRAYPPIPLAPGAWNAIRGSVNRFTARF
jgi:hypothetical protein